MNINQIRKNTQGCTDKIFLNSAGSSLVPDVVLSTMTNFLMEESLTGGYALAEKYRTETQEFYLQTALLLNCPAENIAYTSSSTDGYAKAITSVNFKQDDVILTTEIDYISNQLSFLSLQKRFGIKIVRAGHLLNGDLDLESFANLVQTLRPKLVALTFIPSNSGNVQPAVEVGEICKKYGVLYLLDACQAVGQMVVDVKKIGCDFLTTTGRKFIRGPRGSGILYVSDRVLDAQMAPLIFDNNGASWTSPDQYVLADSAKRFEFFEHSVAAKLGLTAALTYMNEIGIEKIEVYNKELMSQFREKLQGVKGVELHDRGSQLSNILTFTTNNRSLEATTQLLRDNDVYFSLTYSNFALIDYGQKKIKGAIRFSPHYFNTAQELENIIDILSS